MKKLITAFTVLLFSTVLVAAPPPVPQKMSYQAVVRNSSNELVANKTIGMKISIIYNTPTGTVVYAETQTPTTNDNGLISIVIGTGTIVTGTFTSIEWTQGPHFIKTEIDPAGGTAYSIISTSELLSVPYALSSAYTKTAMNAQNLILPFNNNSSYAGTPFSITNTGTSLYTISGISTSGYGIYGETKSENAPGVLGIGSGTGTSSGVMGKTGEMAFEVLPGNVGVQGRSDAHIGVAGTALSGIGGYFSSRTGLALNTKGSIKLTGIGESAGRILTSDAAGNATWQTPGVDVTLPAGVNGNIQFNNSGLFGGDNNLFWNNTNKGLGIGTNAPGGPLHIKTSASEIAIFESTANSKWIAFYQNGIKKGMLWSVVEDIKLRSEGGGLAFQTGGLNTDRMVITADGKTGIGDTTPDATLDVEGTVVIGAAGKVFSEIREITGTSAATGNYSTLGYPSGYTRENTRILSAEINYNGINWNTLGMFNTSAPNTVGCSLSSTGIHISYPEVAAYQSKAIRILLIKVQ